MPGGDRAGRQTLKEPSLDQPLMGACIVHCCGECSPLQNGLCNVKLGAVVCAVCVVLQFTSAPDYHWFSARLQPPRT